MDFVQWKSRKFYGASVSFSKAKEYIKIILNIYIHNITFLDNTDKLVIIFMIMDDTEIKMYSEYIENETQ